MNVGKILSIALLTMVLAGRVVVAQDKPPVDWRSDWELAEGLNIQIDAKGFSFPSQVVFVPDPGPNPNDPLYFVVELKGSVKVVTNDRKVHSFAENILPNQQGPSFVQSGSAGLCLDPKVGYVFVTFAYLDNTNHYRNGIVRLKSQPKTFGVKVERSDYFLDLFKNELSATAHQIGPCQVKDDLVYVTVGYGEDRSQSQNLHSTLGKIIRMTVDFKPVPDNPFYTDDGKNEANDYIWAYGFRNPFGLRFVGDRLFATENGGSVDRFNEIERGENYLWDGTDWSMGARAAQLFSPSIGIVHLDFIPKGSPLFPAQYQNRFISATAGAPGIKGPGFNGARSVLYWEYDFAKHRMADRPRTLVRFRGEGMQIPVSVALGPDGIYFAALLPNSAGDTPIYKITYDPAAKFQYRIGSDVSPKALINKYGCRQCHSIAGGSGGKIGPPLDKTLLSRLTAKLNSSAYEARVAQVNKIESEPFVDYRTERESILTAKGKERVERWLPVYLREPKFDNPRVEMPTLGLSKPEAIGIARFLLQQSGKSAKPIGQLDKLRFALSRFIPEIRYRHLIIAFVMGAVFAWIVAFALIGVARRRRTRSR